MRKYYNTTNTTISVEFALPTLETYYGKDVELTVGVSFENQAAGDFDQITFDTEKGILFGDKDKGGVIADIYIYATNATTTNELVTQVQAHV